MGQTYLDFMGHISKKDEFLHGIKTKPNSESEYKYKRVVTSPIRYPGGKSLGVGFVVELLPDDVKKVISLFFGGGSIEIAMSKYLELKVIGYDIFDILMNYWQFQIEKPKILHEELRKLEPTQETYDEIKNRLQDHWDITTSTFEEWAIGCKRFNRYKTLSAEDKKKEWDSKQRLGPLDLAVHYYFNYNLSYGPGFLGWAGKIYLNDKKYDLMLETVRKFEPGNLKVGCADFKDVFKKYPNDFFYCDPPYYIGEDSKMFKGIYPMRNIPVHHDGFEHDILADLLRNHKGGWILSYNDCPTIRDLYEDFNFHFPSWQYTMGQGETRIGNYRKKDGKDHVKDSHEIMITNI